MSKHEHPWVQDFAAYEAVLCCTNEVHAWDQQATLRAFQTYGFDDASTPGNDQSFKHYDTGVMLLHDGDVVAIQYGGGNLTLALADLFMVLHALGWQKAEVFHPALTMGALLTDMGRAIPAHLDFDVFPSKSGPEANRLPEADALIEKGRGLLQAVAGSDREVEEFNEIALGELESMDPDQAEGSFGALPSGVPERSQVAAVAPVRAQAPVFLEDEFEPMVPVLGERGSATDTQPSVRSPFDRERAPMDLAGQDLTEESPAGVDVAAVVPPARVGVARDQPVWASLVESVAAADRVEMPARVAEPAVPLDPSPDELPSIAMPSHVVLRIGQSALIFDEPGKAIDQQRVREVATDLGAADVLDIWPGAIRQAARWDVLGELHVASPWFAELLADAILPGDAGFGSCLAADMTNMVRMGGSRQLRDLVANVLEGEGAASRYLSPGMVAEYRAAVLKTLGGVFLANNGDGFVDLPVLSEELDQLPHGDPVDVFSVRTLSESAVPKVYVIHRDAVDGRFVSTLVALLQHVAGVYARSNRAQKQAQAIEAERLRHKEAKRAAREREEQRLRAAATIRETMAGLAGQLRDLGVEVAISGA